MLNSRKVAIVLSAGDPTWYTNKSALANSLVGYWRVDESSGNALDSVGSSNLTNTNTVAPTTGKVYTNAGQFVRATSQYYTVADSATLSTGDIRYWVAAWFYLDSKPAASEMVVVGKGDGLSAQQEFALSYQTIPNVVVWSVSDTGVTLNSLSTGFGPSLSTWVFALCYHDSVNDLLGYSINGAAITTQAYSSGSFDGTGAFRIGADSGTVPTKFWDGRIGPVMYGKNYIPTAQDIAFLYNNGNGRR